MDDLLSKVVGKLVKSGVKTTELWVVVILVVVLQAVGLYYSDPEVHEMANHGTWVSAVIYVISRVLAKKDVKQALQLIAEVDNGGKEKENEAEKKTAEKEEKEG